MALIRYAVCRDPELTLGIFQHVTRITLAWHISNCDISDTQCAHMQMGHMPQEDYAEAIQETISKFLQGIKD